MTADDFTTAAFDESHSRLSEAGVASPSDIAKAQGFRDGASWARTHLAAQEADGERAVRELHRRFGVYAHEDECPDTSDEHREAHHHEDSDGYGEMYCDQRPLYAVCDTCRDEDGERVDWPCATIRALDAARRDEEK